MKRLVAFVLLCLMSISAAAQEAKPPVNPPPSAAAAKAAPQAPVKIAGLGRRRELTLRDRLKLGVTNAKAVAAALELAREGEISADTDRSITAARVLDRLAADNPDIDLEDPEFVDRLLEWLEGIFRFIFNELKKQGTQ